MREHRREDAVGAMLGLALGDALGAPFEGRSSVARSEVDHLIADDRPLRWTDDTHMALALAESLLARGRVDATHLGDTFATAYREQPWRGYGPGPPRVFAAAADGIDYPTAAKHLFEGRGSFGNGGAMRCAPAAIAAGGDLSLAAALARDQAVITHAHPEGSDGAIVLAAMIDHALDTDPDEALDAARVGLCPKDLSSPTFRAIWDELCTEGRTARRFGTAAAARESVPTAIGVALSAGEDVARTATAAIALGGDTDTIAAMAATITGAHLGAESIPEHLLSRLEQRERIVSLAHALHGLRPTA